MRYLTCLTQDHVTIAECATPVAGPGEIVVKPSLCGVCGTDVEKVFGAYPKPQKLGHEVVGLVHALGEGVSGFTIGQRVALAHHAPDPSSHYSKRGSQTMDPAFKRSNISPGGFAEFILVPRELVGRTVIAVPAHVSDDAAVFMEPLACCLRAVNRVGFEPGDSALVVGVGAVGMLFMPLLKSLGVIAIATDRREERIALALQWGAAAGARQDVERLCREHSEGRGVDCVVLTVVNPSTIAMGLASLRDGGTLMLFGGKPGGSAEMPLWEIWLREINIISSYSASPQGLSRAMALLATPEFSGIETLISHRLPLGQGQEAFELVKEGRASKVVVMP